MTTRIIWVHSGPDASASLLVGNVLVDAIDQERLTRRKHEHGAPIVETLERVCTCAAAIGLDYLYADGMLEAIHA